MKNVVLLLFLALSHVAHGRLERCSPTLSADSCFCMTSDECPVDQECLGLYVEIDGQSYGSCVATGARCEPQCNGRCKGENDGCGGLCQCDAAWMACIQFPGQAANCQPNPLMVFPLRERFLVIGIFIFFGILSFSRCIICKIVHE